MNLNPFFPPLLGGLKSPWSLNWTLNCLPETVFVAERADDKDGSFKEILAGKLPGKWRVQFSYVDEFYRKQRISRVFPTRTAAVRKQQLGQMLAEL